jgi:hypothetical protein
VIKNYTLRIEQELLQKFHAVADYNGRSVNAQILMYMRKSVANFEKEFGEILLTDSEE